jgi:transcriptional regulator with XRE-family HTH domain
MQWPILPDVKRGDTHNLQQRLGDAIRSRRQALGLSQEEVASRAGLHRTYVGDVERGLRNVSLANIAKLASALGCKASELLREAER